MAEAPFLLFFQYNTGEKPLQSEARERILCGAAKP